MILSIRHVERGDEFILSDDGKMCNLCYNYLGQTSELPDE